MPDLTKIEGGSPYPDWCFLDKLDPNAPSTWGLRTHEIIHGEYQITKRQLDRATTALLSPGYMGNRSHKLSHGLSFPRLKSEMIKRYQHLGISDWDIPAGLWPNGVAPSPPTDGLSHSNPISTFAPYDKLVHFGVKGMRWGVRKDRSGGRKKRAKPETLSDEELRNTVKRMNLERNYADLVAQESKRNASRASRGKDRVQKALTDAGQEQMKNLFSKALASGTSFAVGKAIEEAYDQPLLSPYAPTLEKVKGALSK